MNFRLLFVLTLLIFTSCAQDDPTEVNPWEDLLVSAPEPTINLDVYLTKHRGLEEKVDSIFRKLDDR